jgi:hypothetical protein
VSEAKPLALHPRQDMAATDHNPISAENAPSSEIRCDDCAFTKGTEANGVLWTRVTIELCLIARELFHCHAKGEPLPLCAGYLQALANAPPQPEFRRELAFALLEIQQIAQVSPENCQFIGENFPECVESILEDLVPSGGAR